MGLSLLFSLAFASFLFLAICKASSDNGFAFLHFFLGGDFGHCLIYGVAASVHRSSGPHISDLIPCIYLSHPLYNHKGSDLAYN